MLDGLSRIFESKWSHGKEKEHKGTICFFFFFFFLTPAKTSRRVKHRPWFCKYFETQGVYQMGLLVN